MKTYTPPGFDLPEEGGKRLKLVAAGPRKGWVAYKHPEGQWVSLRKASKQDYESAFRVMTKPAVK